MRGVCFLDQGLAEPAGDEHLRHGDENGQHRHQAELGGQEQTGEDDRHDKADDLVGKAVGEAPEDAPDCLALQLLSHRSLCSALLEV